MSLDQVFMMLTDRKYLRNSKGRSLKMDPLQAATLSKDDDGMIKGRAADGTPIKARIAGKSLAKQMMEKAEQKKKESQQKKKRRRHRGN